MDALNLAEVNGLRASRLSSKALKLNLETHDIGFFLEQRGYVFATPFRE